MVSNEKDYDGRLTSFPGPTAVEADPSHGGFGVSMIRVDEQFLCSGVPRKELRINPIEARAIVADVQARFDGQPDGDPSIGCEVPRQASAPAGRSDRLREQHPGRAPDR